MKSSSFKKTLAVIVALVMSFTTICAPLSVLSADTADDAVTEASQGVLEVKPLRYDYKVGEPVELDVMWIDPEAGITTVLTADEYIIDDYDMYSPGYKNIIVRYGNAEAVVEVYYEGDETVPVEPPVTEGLYYELHRVDYNFGEELDISVYFNGEEIYPETYTADGMVTEGYIVMGYDPYCQGEQCVYITYNEYTTDEFYVYVVGEAMEGTLTVVPHATEFYVGEPVRFDLVWNYPDGNSELISPEEYIYDEIDVSTPGWKTITVYYGDYVISEDVYYVEVPGSVLDVIMNREGYYVGEQLDMEVFFNGMLIMPAEITDDGMITDGYTVEGYNPYREGEQEIVISYNGEAVTRIVYVKMGSEFGFVQFGNSFCVMVDSYYYSNLNAPISFTVYVQSEDGTYTPVDDYLHSESYSKETKIRTVGITRGDETVTFDVMYQEEVVEPTIVGITAYSNIEAYNKGDNLDLTVQVEYSDGSTAVVEDYTVAGYDPNVTGWQWITVYYREFGTKIEVYVQESTDDTTKEVISVNADNYVYAYVGEIPYIKMYARYSDGTERRISGFGDDCYTLSGYNPKLKGEQNVQVTYGGFTSAVTVNVTEKPEGEYFAHIDSHMNKTEYNLGEQLDMVVIAYYNQGGGIELSPDQYVVEGYDCWQSGYQNVTIYYENMSSSWGVTVIGNSTDVILEYIEVINNRGNYSMGESLDLTVFAYYSNGEAVEISNYSIENYDAYMSGWQSVVVKYLNCEAVIDIYVEEDIVEPPAEEFGLTIEYSNTYYYGEAYNFVVYANYNDGRVVEIPEATADGSDGYVVSGFDSYTLGEQTVYITYRGEEVSIIITIIERDGETYVTDLIVENNKEQYNIGDSLELSVFAYYSNGDVVEVYDYAVDGYDPYIGGWQTISVTFEGYVYDLDVYVAEQTDEEPYVIGIRADEAVTYPGQGAYFRVYAQYSNGMERRLSYFGTDPYKYSGYDMSAVGTHEVTIYYQNFETTTYVNVLEKPVTMQVEYIEVFFNKVEYALGEELDIVVDAYFSGGYMRELKPGLYNVSGFDNTVTGDQLITVEYNGKIAKCNVTVYGEDVPPVEPPVVNPDEIVGFEVVHKPTYNYGEAHDFVVTVKYADGTAVEIPEAVDGIDGYTVTGFDSYKLGEQSIYVTYRDAIVTFDITIIDPEEETIVERIEVINKREQYFTGDELDIGVIAYYTNGNMETVYDYEVIGYDNSKEGYCNFTVIYGDCQHEMSIYFTALYSLEIIDLKNSYMQGEELQLEVSLRNNKTYETTLLTRDEYEILDYDSTIVGWQYVTVAYGDIIGEIQVYIEKNTTGGGGSGGGGGTVEPEPSVKLTGIRAENNKEEYIVGDQLDISVFAVYSDDTEEEIFDYNISGFDSSVSGSNDVIICYGSYTFEMSVYVAPLPEKSIIYMNDITTLGGFEVKVPVYIRNNQGFAAYDIEIYYDNAILAPVSIEKGEIMTGNITSNLSSSFDAANNNLITAVGYGKENITADGVLFYITFKVLDGVTGETSPDIEVVEMYDQDRNFVETEIQYGTINVISALYGDADGNGAISVADLIFMSQYVANWTGNYDDIFMKLADVYNDGTVNTKDIVLLARYIAKVPGVELGKPIN